ncbi:MAG: DUF6517 family protein [Halolamina sp.]|uniref:DUF6517 family protein n=1 Tax=Halolamina sp. TaxID=1940283 RepID=UPI002FC3C0CE
MIGKLLQLAVVGLLLSAAAGGGWLVGGGPLRGHADEPATVDAQTAQELGFTEPEVEEIQLQETIEVQGVEKRLNVSAYMMATGTETGAVQVAVMSLPGWTVAGVTMNPLAYVPLKQAVKHVLPNLPAETPEVAWEGESTVELGEKEVTAGEYAVEGESARIVVARASMEGDLVFAVGIYSTESQDARDRIEGLFSNLSH